MSDDDADIRSDQRTARRRPQFHGRRVGRRLGLHRRELVESLLPRLRIDPRDAAVAEPTTLFDEPKSRLWMEIGFGAGEHLAGRAERHPEIGFIGSEPFMNGVAAYLSKHEAAELRNVRLFDDDVRLLLPKLPDGCLDRLYILFADPWPKRRHRRRRMVGPENLGQFARLLKPGADLWFATDHMGHGRWALWHLLADRRFRWCAEGPGDWSRPADWIETRYERKALEDGASCLYYRFLKLS